MHTGFKHPKELAHRACQLIIYIYHLCLKAFPSMSKAMETHIVCIQNSYGMHMCLIMFGLARICPLYVLVLCRLVFNLCVRSRWQYVLGVLGQPSPGSVVLLPYRIQLVCSDGESVNFPGKNMILRASIVIQCWKNKILDGSTISDFLFRVYYTRAIFVLLNKNSCFPLGYKKVCFEYVLNMFFKN